MFCCPEGDRDTGGGETGNPAVFNMKKKPAHETVAYTKGSKGKPKHKKTGPPYSVFEGRIYRDDEREWLMAIDAMRRRLKRIPTLAEGFRLALELGYRRD